MTQEEATIKVNKYKKGKSVSRQSLAKKENKLAISFYEQLSQKLHSEIKKNMYDKYMTQIIAVDGTYPTFLNSLSNDGYKSNKKKNSVTPLVTGLYNVTYNFPIMLSMTKHKDERKAFIDLISDKLNYKNSIFVFDKGYISDDLF